MDLQPVVLMASDLDSIFEFETERLRKRVTDADELMLLQWNSPWRREALEHYLSLGWSMKLNDASRSMKGYFLAQPFLFMRGQTQTLWIEHIGAESETLFDATLDVAVRLSRDKHLQRVLVQGVPTSVAQGFRFKGEYLSDRIFEVKTTKG